MEITQILPKPLFALRGSHENHPLSDREVRTSALTDMRTSVSLRSLALLLLGVSVVPASTFTRFEKP